MGLTILPFKDQRPIKGRSRRAAWLGVLAGVMSHFRRPRRLNVTTTDLRRHDFPTSTQRLGVRYGERIRDIFRHRWLRLNTMGTVQNDRHDPLGCESERSLEMSSPPEGLD